MIDKHRFQFTRCDPLTLGTLAIGAAGTAANSIGQAKATKKQKQVYEEWANSQRQNRANENLRQDALRQDATAAQQKGVQDVSADNQKALQDAEQARLTASLAGEDQPASGAGPAPEATADSMISGGQYGGDVFQEDFAKQLSDAMASAKQRIGAMATTQSFGDSQFGLGTLNPVNQARAGAGIDLANNYRGGSLDAYRAEQAVDPEQISYSNPIADVASSFLGVGMQGLGKGVAGGAGGGLGKLFSGKITSAPSLLPKTTTAIPMPRLF